MIGRAYVAQEAVDGLRALVRGGIRREGLDLGEAGRYADGVESDAAEEDEVLAERHELGRQGAVVGPDGAFLDPLLDGGDISRGESMTLRRHEFVGVQRLDAQQQRTLSGVAGNDRCPVGLAALECASSRVEV